MPLHMDRRHEDVAALDGEAAGGRELFVMKCHEQGAPPSSALRSRDAWMGGVTDATRIRQLWVGDDGIARIECWPGAAHTREDAREALMSIGELTGPRPRFALVDLRRCQAVDPGAEAVYTGPAAAGLLIAAALVVSSSLTCAVSNFLMARGPSSVPARWFASKHEALEWLHGFVVAAVAAPPIESRRA
jgi:hypothetical protein